MEKITDFKGITKYFCSLHQHFHLRKYNYEFDEYGKRIRKENTPFFNCKEYAFKLTPSEIFNLGFKKSWNCYTIKDHKKTYKSRKQ